MFTSIRNKVAQNLINYKGWNTDRKIIVFESDDWGSIRMPSQRVYSELLNKEIPVDKSPYCKYDSLASEEDLNALLEQLSAVTDSNGRNPIFTANVVTTNPDFEKIKKSEFKQYHYELISKTFQRYPSHSNCLQIWKEGIRSKLFYPQFHGREHVNISLWLRLLQKGDKGFRVAFNNECWGLSCDVYPDMDRSVQASFDMANESEISLHKKSIIEGLNQFEDLFGYRSRSFIANNFIWDSRLNKVLSYCGIKYIQGMKYQKLPLNGHKNRKFHRHYLGEKNNSGQTYLIRNCSFEPSLCSDNSNAIKSCMGAIDNAFYWNKPAIISTHRINYVGFIDTKNRDRNLNTFKKLLDEIINKWPEVEFMTSVELGRLINNKS